MYKTSELAERYKEKLITADEAAAQVQPGDRIHFGLGCGQVVDIDEALSLRADELKDVTIISTASLVDKPFKTYEPHPQTIRCALPLHISDLPTVT